MPFSFTWFSVFSREILCISLPWVSNSQVPDVLVFKPLAAGVFVWGSFFGSLYIDFCVVINIGFGVACQ